mmetsp:Transcript_10825/g.13107  ORF Transcript_10825/g.13107 Transcript_10825/m.13107 type:complete len:212 (-) Transcript_10825:125-760(-)
MDKVADFQHPFFETNRFYLMIASSVVAVLTFILYCVGLAGSSTDEDNVSACSWGQYEFSFSSNDYVSYYGTRAAVTTKDDDVIDVTKYSGNSCNSGSLCDDCAEAGDTAIAFLCLAFLMSFPLFVISVFRMTTERDTAGAKLAALIFGVASLICVIISMSSFGSCLDAVKDQNGVDEDDFSYGPAFNCMGITILLIVIMFVVHLLTPAKKA